MTHSHQDIAAGIVAEFRDNLSEATRQHIDSEQFAHLASLICAALSAEQAVAVDLVEELLARLRARLDAPQLEL